MELIKIISDNKVQPRLSYVIDLLNKHPFVEKSDIRFEIGKAEGTAISFGTKKGVSDFLIPEANYIFQDNDQEPIINRYLFEEEVIYSVEKEKRQDSLFCKDGLFGFDIFEGLFFHLSRYEERFLKQGDYLGNKFEFEQQLLLVKSGLEKIPVVDDLVKAFLQVITRTEINIKRPISLSHDIDYIQKFKTPLSIARKIAGHFRHNKPLSSLPKLWKSYLDFLLKGEDSFDTFEWMLSKREIDKSIYFLVGGNHKEDNQYDLKHPIFQKALKLAKIRDYKIGIHPSYESWNNIDLMRGQKEKLENEVGEDVIISRQHFLNFDIEVTPRLLQTIGITEDSSIGYTRFVGYRCGTGFPYLLYDFENEKAFNLLERPLVFMDSSWFFESKRHGKMDLAFHKYSGSFNFHNSFFHELEMFEMDFRDKYQEMFVDHRIN